MTSADFDFVRGIVLRSSAMVLNDDKTYLAEARLLKLARREGLASLTDLLARLRSGPEIGLQQRVVEAMTINETSFFRDDQPFAALRNLVLPEIIRDRAAAARQLNIWSAASSTGQEAYTIALVLLENFPVLSSWKVKILGTDLSREVLETARQGRYSQSEVNRGMPSVYLMKYFDKEGADWRLKPIVRNLVEFRPLNLIEPWSNLPTMDIVFLRNVLIYFDVATKKRILERVRQVLRLGGYLFLGGAETTLNLDDHFERVNYERAGCYRLSRHSTRQ